MKTKELIRLGCHVQIDSAYTRPKSNSILAVPILHILRALVLFAIGGFISTSPILIIIASLEIFIAYWFWTMKFEAWGIAAGFTLFHIVLPLAAVSMTGFALIAILCTAELLFLAIVRKDGYFSFEELSKFDPADTRKAGLLQLRVFQIVVLAQIIKSIFLFQGSWIIYTFGEPDLQYGWFMEIPDIPIVIILGIVNLIAAVGFLRGHDWGFHVIVLFAAWSLFETTVSLSSPVLLISIWIIMLMTTCLSKDGFYPKLLMRVRSRNMVSSISQEIPQDTAPQEHL